MLSHRVRFQFAAKCLAAFTLLLCVGVAHAVPYILAYHDQNTAQHETLSADYKAQGYRPISLSIYGTASDPRYAAVWAHKPGANFQVHNNKTLAQMEAIRASAHGQGYRMSMVSATGETNPNNPGDWNYNGLKFAFVLEQDYSNRTFNPMLTRSGVLGSMDFAVDNARSSNQKLRWLTSYGAGDNRRYTAIFEPNPTTIAWTWGPAEALADFEKRLTAHQMQDARPALISGAGNNVLTSIWQDDSLGEYKTRLDMTSAEYQDQFDTLGAQGYFPLTVNAWGSGSNTRFSAVFVKDDTPIQRQWTVTGQAEPALANLDTLIKNHMQLNGIRGGQLAIVKKGKLVYARGYTWSEPGYPTTQPTTTFRIASVSKPITSIGIHQVMQEGSLSETDTLQSIMHVKTPTNGNPVDNRWNDITVDHLLYHTSGFAGDWLYSDTGIADEIGWSLPITKQQASQYIATKALGANPGDEYVYSNQGYMFLGRIIEAKRGADYHTTLKNSIFKPLGVTRTSKFRMDINQQAPGEVRYHDANLTLRTSVMDNTGDPLPTVYGSINFEKGDGPTNWVMATPDLGKVLAAFDMGFYNPILSNYYTNKMWSHSPGFSESQLKGWKRYEANDTVDAFYHAGAMSGTGSEMFRRTDKISVCVFFNNSWAGELFAPLNDLIDDVNVWPSGDKFPSVGIPSLKAIGGSFNTPVRPTHSNPNRFTMGTLEIIEPTTGRLVKSLNIDDEDYLIDPGVPAGTYTLLFKARGSLNTRLTNVNITDGITDLPDVTMRGGDTDGDNDVDDFDLFNLTRDFLLAPNQNGFITDFNADGKVDDFDLFILTGNFLEVGD